MLRYAAWVKCRWLAQTLFVDILHPAATQTVDLQPKQPLALVQQALVAINFYSFTPRAFSGRRCAAMHLGEVDILPALKDGNSCCQAAMSRRENVPCCIHVAVVYRT
ncbi:MAG: hypothetical protein K2X65_08645, partial [Burkholderiaceae bacterium]|nr:hypothetical protein [Burkholderiaceae bacterium]